MATAVRPWPTSMMRRPDAGEHGKAPQCARAGWSSAGAVAAQRCGRSRNATRNSKVEICGDNDQFEEHGGVEELVDAGGDACDFKKGKRHLGQLVEAQPEILFVALLGKIKGEKKYRQHGKEDGDEEARKALEDGLIPPEIEGAVEVVGVAQDEGAVGEEAGIGGVADGDVKGSDGDDHVGGVRGDVEAIDARHRLVAGGVVAMRTIRLDLLAVREDVNACAAAANGNGEVRETGNCT